jgi:hypothetical protein
MTEDERMGASRDTRNARADVWSLGAVMSREEPSVLLGVDPMKHRRLVLFGRSVFVVLQLERHESSL